MPEDRLPFVLEWSASPIVMAREMLETLEKIGETPADRYGNGRDERNFPCGAVTDAGERIDLATVSFRSTCPYGAMNYRLATEIVAIYASPYALPLDVRRATSEAHETHMGLAPTPLIMPSGQLFVLNGRADFFVKSGYVASQARLATSVPQNVHPEIIGKPKEVVYFIADP